MFEGPIGKQMMIDQGYVPKTCTLSDKFAGLVIYVEVSRGVDPCARCNSDRTEYLGRPNTVSQSETSDD